MSSLPQGPQSNQVPKSARGALAGRVARSDGAARVLAIAAGSLVLAAACLVPVDLGGEGFACSGDEDCPSPQACVDGVCRASSGGERDAGGGDAGAGADGGDQDGGSDGGADAGDAPDAGTPQDAGSCEPAVSCPADAALCERFLDPAITGWVQTTVDSDAGVDGGPPRWTWLGDGGCEGGWVEATLGSGVRAELTRSVAPAAEVFARVMLFVPKNFRPTENLRLFAVEIEGAANVVGLNDDQGGSVYVDPSGTGLKSGPSLPRDRWTCVELALKVGDATTGNAQLYVDGVLVAEHAAATAPNTAPALAAIRLGPVVTSAQPEPVRVAFDDVAIAHQRVGCQ